MDIVGSDRALKLRKKVLQMGFPCAVSFPPFLQIRELLPLACVLTFQDAIPWLQSAVPEGVPILVVGKGFVSKMCPVFLYREEAELIVAMKLAIQRFLHGEEVAVSQDSSETILPHGFVLLGKQLCYRFIPIPLTPIEKRILMTILTSKEAINSFRRLEAFCFPYPYKENIFACKSLVTPHISRINTTTQSTCRKRFLRYVQENGGGYRYDTQPKLE